MRNRPCKKNYESGKLVQILLLLWILVVSDSVEATVDRMLWFFDQAGKTPDVVGGVVSRNQAGFSFVNFRDAISGEISGVFDAKAVEFVVRGSQRTYLSLDTDGRNEQSFLSSKNKGIFAEVARLYRTDQGVFGRLALGVGEFLPEGSRWVKLGLDTGVLTTPELPWSLGIHLGYMPSLSQQSDFLLASGEIAHQLTEGPSALQLGFGISWDYRFGALASNSGDTDFEHMLFSLGPLFKWKSHLGTFRSQIFFRILIDESSDMLDDGTLTNIYPAELGLPDLNIGWTVSF